MKECLLMLTLMQQGIVIWIIGMKKWMMVINIGKQLKLVLKIVLTKKETYGKEETYWCCSNCEYKSDTMIDFVPKA